MIKILSFYTFFLTNILINSQFLWSQENNYYDENFDKYGNYIYNPNIQSVQVHRDGWELTYPVIRLNTEDKLRVSFDDLSDNQPSYSYTIIHCDKNWKPSDLNASDYIDGFQQVNLERGNPSFNTRTSFMHYSFTLPKDDLKIKISGNYLIKVFSDYDPANVIFTSRFVVYERLVQVEAIVKRTSKTEYRAYGQEVDFTIKNPNFMIQDPLSQVSASICQNNRWDNSKNNLKPQFIKPGEIVFDYDDENVFEGGSEFLFFDIKNIKFKSERVYNLQYVNPYYHFELIKDETYTNHPYVYRQDINGRRVIHMSSAFENSTEADYVIVHFTLPFEAPLFDGDMYVWGELSNWNFSDFNKMKYDIKRKAYTHSMLLKQGYYNYQYVYVKHGQNRGDAIFVGGNHYETENDYLIYIYFRDFSSRYDRVIGFSIINSVKRL